MGYMRVAERLLIKCVIGVDYTFSIFLRILGPMLVVLANSLIGLVVYVYLTIVLPALSPRLPGVAIGAIVVLGLYLLFNILFNYWGCILTRPGWPGHHLTEADEEEVGAPARFKRFCKKCECPKPARTHHCSVCRRCVMKMDHHCPWVNNCVGFYNYKYFVLFLVYMHAGCAYTAMSCGVFVWEGRGHGGVPVQKHGFLLFAFVLTLSVLFALTLFLVWHAFLVATNQTTIEFYSNRFDASDARARGEVWRNPYNLGMRGNFEQVFGMSRHPLSWLLPSLKPPPGDGMEFPQNPSGDGTLRAL
jgi:palmitoyltransferase